MARKLGYLDFPDSLVVPMDQALNMPDNEVVIMCTGSQGEPTSILGRLSIGTNRLFDIENGDTVVLSSHPIPGNEENVYRVINRLFQRGANVIYEAIAPVHVSGHASQEEMKLLHPPDAPQILHPHPRRAAPAQPPRAPGRRSGHPGGEHQGHRKRTGD